MKRPPGRPPLDDRDPSVPLQISLPSQQLAACEQKAKADRLTVQEWLRRVIRHATGGEDKS